MHGLGPPAAYDVAVFRVQPIARHFLCVCSHAITAVPLPAKGSMTTSPGLLMARQPPRSRNTPLSKARLQDTPEPAFQMVLTAVGSFAYQDVQTIICPITALKKP